MKYLLPIDNKQAYKWAYENGLSSLPYHVIDNIAWNGEDISKYCPTEVEIEFYINRVRNMHPCGSNTATESWTEVEAMVDDKPVTVPYWLEDKLMENAL